MENDPRGLDEVVAEAGLGDLFGRYRSSLGLDVSTAVACAVLGVVLLTAGAGAPAVMALGVVFLALGALCGWLARRKFTTCRYVYANGTLTTDHRGAVTSVVIWTDVAHLRIWVRVVNLITAYAEVLQCRLVLTGGEVIDLAKPRYKDKPELVAFVEEHVSAALYPRKVDEVVRTGAATFGPLTLTDAGVGHGEVLAAWSAITKAEVGKTRLRIWTDGRRPLVSVHLRDVPDLAILRHMLQHWPVAPADGTSPATEPDPQIRD
ncbi:hypothetical protein Ate01nite_06160 [Actinoplanes teichomyceticus]|nr:hypothetical protein Ate01nite_06160 [Actinoplanes teichomyceticus]